jgi:hypothetical protein
MSHKTVISEARPRFFRLFRKRGAGDGSSMLTHGRLALGIAAVSCPTLYIGNLAVAWQSSVIAVLLGINELVFRRKATHHRHPRLAVAGILLGLFVLASSIFMWRCEIWWRRITDQPRNYIAEGEPAIGTPVHAQLAFGPEFAPPPQSTASGLTNVATAETLEVLPRWKKGEVLYFQRVASRQKGYADKVTFESTCRTNLQIEVVDIENDMFVLAWTWGETKFDDPRQAANPLVQNAINLAKGCPIVLVLDSQAGIREVRNWKEQQDLAMKALNLFTNELKANGIERAAIDAIRAQVAAMFVTKQAVELFCTREPQIFFMALGMEFRGQMPLQFEDKLPNPLGGEPIPSRSRLVLKELDKKQGLAKVTWNQTASTDIARLVEKPVKQMAQRLGKNLPDEGIPNFPVTLEDSAEFSFELSSGWPQSLTHKRRVEAEGGWQEDVITITRDARRKD